MPNSISSPQFRMTSTTVSQSNEERPKAPDGVIRFVVNNVTNLDEDGQYSSSIDVKGVPWVANVWNDDEDLVIGLVYKTDQVTPFTIDVEAQFILVHSGNNNSNIILEERGMFGNKAEHLAKEVMDWEEFIADEKGFIKDDKITVEIRFWISKMEGVRTIHRTDFTDRNDPCHDVALIIEGEKIYVNKGILAVFSSVFRVMFQGDFAEKNKKEIELKDVNREEFIELLRVIYPSCKKITEESAEYLLKLADQFQITSITERIEDFLVGSDKVPNLEKIRIADHYRLFGLLKYCLSDLKTIQDFRLVKESPIYRGLSDATKATLFEHVMDLPI